MLIRTPQSRFLLEVDEANRQYQRLFLDLVRSRVPISRRGLFKGAAGVAVASGLLQFTSSQAFAANYYPIYAIAAGPLLRRGAMKLLGRGAQFLATWWLSKKLAEWQRSFQPTIGAGGYEGASEDSRWVGPSALPRFPITQLPPSSQKGGSAPDAVVEVVKNKFTQIVQESIEAYTHFVNGVLNPKPGGPVKQAEGSALIVAPRDGARTAKVYCIRDVDAGHFEVPKSVMPTYVGRRSNWVQVLHPNWRAVALPGSTAVPELGYQFMDARDLSWTDDNEFKRLAVYDSAELSDHAAPECKPAHLFDRTCVDR